MIEKPCGLCRGGTVEYAADCGHFFHFKCLEDMKFMQWECIICKLEREDKIAKEVLALYVIEKPEIPFEEIFELLRREGWNVDEAVDHRQSTAVILSCQYENVPVLKYLIQKGADTSKADYFSMAPLHYACEYQNFEVFGLLLGSGADINAVNLESKSPLIWACSRGQVEFVKILLDRGADMSGALSVVCGKNEEISDESRMVLADLLISHGVKVYRETVCDAIKLGNVTGSIQTTVLETCIQEGNVAILEILLQNGAKLNDSEATNYLKISCINDRLEMLKYLASKGMKLSSSDINRNTLLHFAVSEEIIEYLLESTDLKIDAKNSNGDTPLMLACEKENRNIIIGKFLSLGADINAVNNDGLTPFLVACKNGIKYSAQHLAFKGANVNAKDSFGRNAFHFNTVIDRFFVIEELVQLHVDVNAADKNGNRFIHLFTQNANEFSELIRELFIKVLKPAGLDFNAVDGEGRTALELAVTRGCPQEYTDTLKECTSKPYAKKSSFAII